jgi:RNA polymerase sigma factor (sigma-70 family)
LDNQVHQFSLRSASADESPRETLDVAALTRSMSKGDEMAYRIFYDAYVNRLLRYLLVVTGGNEETTREALQLTFVRVVRHIKVFTDEATFWSWLTVLARSALADESRKRRRYLAFLDRFAQHAAVQQDMPSDDHTDERLSGLLEHSMASLPADERQLVEAKYFARRSVREIAGEFQTTEKAIESRLTRVRRKLKDAVLAALKQ